MGNEKFQILVLTFILALTDCHGPNSDCSSSIPCHHGECDETKQFCLCHGCWEGPDCNQYVDNHGPRFSEASRHVTVSPLQSGVLFAVTALDADVYETCQQRQCPCGRIRYNLIDSDDHGLFEVDMDSGKINLSPGKSLVAGSEYFLVIRASNYHLKNETSQHQDDTLKVILEVLDTFEDEDGDEILSRWRRAARQTGFSNETVCSLTSSPNATTMSIGDREDFTMEMTVPSGLSMTIAFEIFTVDPKNNHTAFAICNLRKESGSKIQTTDTTDPEYIRSIDYPDLNDRITLDFGVVKAISSSIAADRKISINFSTFLLDNQPYIVDGGSYSVIVGATYDDDTYIWIGQAIVTATVQTQPEYPSNVRLEGPSQIAIAGYTVYTVTLNSANPIARYSLNISGISSDGTPDSFSQGPIVMTSTGKNFPCNIDDRLEYGFQLIPSETGNTIEMSMMTTGQFINCDNTGRANPNNVDNEIQFKFLSYVPDDNRLLGKDFDLKVSATIDDLRITSNTLKINIGNKQSTSAGMPSMFIGNSTITGLLKATTTIQVDIVIPENSYAEMALEVEVPQTETETAALSICSYDTSGGANIPYSPMNQEPELTSAIGQDRVHNRMVARLGRIWSADLIKGNQSASTVTINVFVRIEDQSANGQTVSIKLTNTDGSTVYETDTVTVKVVGKSALESGNNVRIQMVDFFKESPAIMSIEGESATTMTISMEAVKDRVADSMSVEIMGSLGNETISGRICRAEVTFVGKNMPCVNKLDINRNVNYRKSKRVGTINDLATVDLGSICVKKLQRDSIHDQLELSIAFELPKQPTATDGTLYTLYSDVKIGGQKIWTGSMTYEVQEPTTAIFNRNELPVVNGFLSPDTPPYPGSVVLVFILVKTPPGSRDDFVLTVSTGSELGICKITILRVGRNFPCVDGRDIDGTGANRTCINYDPRDETLGVYSKATIDFGSLMNLGRGTYDSGPKEDENTITVAAAVKLVPDATDDLSVTFSMKYTKSAEDTSGSVTIPIDSTTLPAFSSPNMTLEAFNWTSNDIHVNLTKILVYRFQVPKETVSRLSILFQNLDGTTEDYGFCSAAVTKIGKNIPCLNATTVTVKTNDTTSNNCIRSSLILDLGDVCHVPLHDDPNEDWVTVEVAIKIINPALTGQVSATVTLMASTSQYKLDPFTLTISNEPISVQSKQLVLTPLLGEKFPVKVGARTWIDMNMTIPRDYLSTVMLTVIGASSDHRAVIIVTAIKISAAGINVACINNATDRNTELRSSRALTTKQKDTATMEFGYVLNTGFTYRRGDQNPLDDMVTISVEVVVTDHPTSEADSEFPLSFQAETDDGLITKAAQILVVVRDGTEEPKIHAEVQVLNPALFHPHDVINVRLLMRHEPTSTAEPTNAIIRLYLPQYMSYTPPVSANVSITESITKDVPILKTTDPFLFDGIYEINFTLSVDPTNKRGSRAGTIDLINIGRITAQMTQRNINGTLYPASATDYLHAADPFTISYRITGDECRRPLGMMDGKINDCQLSASTATDVEHGPANARLKAPSGIVWRPALRDNGYSDYLQVDFGNRTMVVGIDIEKDECCRAPTSIRLQGSETGLKWNDIQKVSDLSYSEENNNTARADLDIPFEGRFLRLVIDGVDVDEPENKATKYIGIKVEFYGCLTDNYLKFTGTLPELCQSTPRTIQSTDVSRYRHFSVDTQNNAVFACDFKVDRWDLSCFCSADGSKWKSLPNYINKIIGYDGSADRTYASDSHNTTLLSSNDCINWLPTSSQNLKDALMGSRFTHSTVISGLTIDDPSMIKTIGKWKATYEGLFFEETKKLGWSLILKN